MAARTGAESLAGLADKAALFGLAAAAIESYHVHAMTSGPIGNSIGLALEEEPSLTANGEQTLDEDGDYSLRVGPSGKGGHLAIVSAMVAAHQNGNELLWSSL